MAKKNKKIKEDPVRVRKWNSAIIKTKDIFDKVVLHQLSIAALALEVCEITRGGNVKGRDKNMFTVSRFAKESGICMKTLSGWIATKRLVYDRLPAWKQKEAEFSDLTFVSRYVTKETPSDEVRHIYDNHMNCDTFERKILRYVQDLKSLHYNFEKQAAALKLSDMTLAEIMFYCRRILVSSKRDKPGVKSKQTGASIRRPQSASAAILGRKMPLRRPAVIVPGNEEASSDSI